MLFQVYFEKPLGSSEWGCLPEYCSTLLSPFNGNDQTTIINAGLGNNAFEHTGPQPVPELEGFYIPLILPANSVLQGEQMSQWPSYPFQIPGGYAIAGIIIQQENVLLLNEHHEDCQQVSSVYVRFFLVLFLVTHDFPNVCSNLSQLPNSSEFVSFTPETWQLRDVNPDAFHSLYVNLHPVQFI